jgi:hypothetical protein
MGNKKRVTKNNWADQRNKSKLNHYPSHDVEIVAGADPTKAKLAYLGVGSGLKSISKWKKVTLCKQTAVP